MEGEFLQEAAGEVTAGERGGEGVVAAEAVDDAVVEEERMIAVVIAVVMDAEWIRSSAESGEKEVDSEEDISLA